MPKIVAIHQPNFLPWLGYFDKIIRSDIFIFLDDVQFSKTGGVWSNRVKLLISGEARWMTAPIDRGYHGTRLVSEMKFMNSMPWRDKLLKSIHNSYQRHPFFGETIEVLKPLILNAESNIAAYNRHAVTTLAEKLGSTTTEFRCSSQIEKVGTSNEMLATLTLNAGGDTYLCGGGASDYHDEAIYKHYGVSLRYQNFAHPVYPQRPAQDFTSGLSVVDATMNLGWAGVTALLAGDAIAAT
jgi:hypothetical protein